MFRKLMSLFYKVNQVQNQADSLNELIYGSEFPSDDAFAQKTYGMTYRQCERLGVMILKYQDETLGTLAVRRLQHILNKNSKAMAYYMDFQQLTAMLILYYHTQANTQTSPMFNL